MLYDFKKLRVPARYPVYPPYHNGPYLEEYFYNFYIKNKKDFDTTGYTLIPIYWTSIYNQNENRNLIQEFLDALPKGKYFCVSQHDDAITEKLPIGTISFEAGGNKNGIPLPLICSSITNKEITSKKEFFCSFVGAITHDIRKELYNLYYTDNDFRFIVSKWSPVVTNEQFGEFINTTTKSEFTLCPRGYGPSSFRLYEALQLNSIPVYVFDKEWLPFKNVINWKEFCVLVEQKDISNLKNILMSFSKDEKCQMLKKGKEIYQSYFTLEQVSKQILKTLKSYE